MLDQVSIGRLSRYVDLFNIGVDSIDFTRNGTIQTPADIEKWPLSFGTINNPFIEA